MSEQPQPRPPAPGRNPWVTALLVILGIIMLLPGLCAVILTGVMLSYGGPVNNTEDLQLLFILFLIGAGGVVLLVFAVRRR